MILTLAEEKAVRWAISAPGPRMTPVLDQLRLKLEAREHVRAQFDAQSARRSCGCAHCTGPAPKGAA